MLPNCLDPKSLSDWLDNSTAIYCARARRNGWIIDLMNNFPLFLPKSLSCSPRSEGVRENDIPNVYSTESFIAMTLHFLSRGAILYTAQKISHH